MAREFFGELAGRTGAPTDSAPKMLVALTGFLAGIVHVVTGPDHLAAVAPLAVRAHRKAVVTGVRWGLGHSAGVAFVGLLALALRETLPVAWLSSVGERLVGVLLLGVGAWSLRLALRVQVHTHAHTHDGEAHAHIHVHDPQHRHADEAAPHVHGHLAFGIGTLHGLAGASHFLGVLPALALPSRAAAGTYLLMFACGTVLAMAVFTLVLGALSARCAPRGGTWYRNLMAGCACVAFGVGGWWIWAGA